MKEQIKIYMLFQNSLPVDDRKAAKIILCGYFKITEKHIVISGINLKRFGRKIKILKLK